ncbi:MAG: peptidoglycan bridge formation glycyltransferase FemA/FemB family protein [bacterium]|nr:peptidoglycan bridge formation glycyltransferase FemA/FemB family protein [bacterium]
MLNPNQPLPVHLCQSPLWQEFRRRLGYQVVEVDGLYFSLHPTPLGNVGYCPKPNPEKIDWAALTKAGKESGCLHIKIDSPNTLDSESWEKIRRQDQNLTKTKSTFAQETIFINLTVSEEELLTKMEQKTRYNVRLAEKRGVRVEEANDAATFSTFLTLQKETAARQHFYLHPDRYYQTLWELTQPEGVAHLLVAKVNQKICAAWMVFAYAKVLSYLYGGSSDQYQNLMPNNLLVWEAMKLGKRLGCELFDLGGINTDPHHPWAGLTRFKLGFGGQVVKFPDSYDLVLNPLKYRLFRAADQLRWWWLNFRR